VRVNIGREKTVQHGSRRDNVTFQLLPRISPVIQRSVPGMGQKAEPKLGRRVLVERLLEGMLESRVGVGTVQGRKREQRRFYPCPFSPTLMVIKFLSDFDIFSP
jgi:hypothetical protein